MTYHFHVKNSKAKSISISCFSPTTRLQLRSNCSFRISSFKTNYQIMSLPADKLIYFARCTQNGDRPTYIILALGWGLGNRSWSWSWLSSLFKCNLILLSFPHMQLQTSLVCLFSIKKFGAGLSTTRPTRPRPRPRPRSTSTSKKCQTVGRAWNCHYSVSIASFTGSRIKNGKCVGKCSLNFQLILMCDN